MEKSHEAIYRFLNPIDSDQFINEENIFAKYEMLSQLDRDLFNEIFADEYKNRKGE